MQLVKLFQIKYIDDLNQVFKASIVALNKNDAMNKLNISKSSFISSSIKYSLNKGIDINTQMQILTRISGGVLSGEAINQYLPSILEDFKNLKSNKILITAEISKGKTLAQLLSYLNIDQTCIKLIENGERSGKLSQSIKDAKQFLKLEDKTQKATTSTLKSQFLILLVAFGLVLGFPSFVVNYYEDIKASGMTIDYNFSTQILFFLNDFSLAGLSLLIIIVALVVINKRTFLERFERVYPISVFQNIISTRQSILFLSIFTPLFKAGMKTQQIFSAYSSVNLANAKHIEQKTLEGVSISDAVQDLAFSNTFKSGFKGFNPITNQAAKLDMLSELFDSLVDDIESYSKQASLLIEIVAKSLIYGILLIIVHGFVLPQLSIGVAI